MINPMICLISLIQLSFLPVSSVGFVNDEGAKEFSSDTFDLEPIIETGSLSGLSTWDTADSDQVGNNLLHVNQDHVYGWSDIHPDYYHITDFRDMDNLLPRQHKRAQTEKYITLVPSTIQVTSNTPIEDPLSSFNIAKESGISNQENLNELLALSKEPLRPWQGSGTTKVKNIPPREDGSVVYRIGNNLDSTSQQEAIKLLPSSRHILGILKNPDTKQNPHSFSQLIHQKKPKAKSKFQEHREAKKRFQGEHDQTPHYSVNEKTFNLVLQWQFKLLLAKRYKVSEMIERFMNTLEESLTAKLKDVPEGSRNVDALHRLIETIRSDLVMGILGAVKIIFQRKVQRKVGVDLINHLILDLWEYLQKYLTSELSILPEEYLKTLSAKHKRLDHRKIAPGKLLEYTFNLTKDKAISSRIVHQKLEEWASNTRYKCYLSDIPLDYNSFVEECDNYYKQKGDEKSVYLTPGQTRLKGTNQQDDTGKHLANKRKHSTSHLPTDSFVYVVKDEAAYVLGDEVHVFFSKIHDEINSISKPELDEKSVYKGFEILSKEIVRKAIYTAQHELTPAFMGLLMLIHPGIEIEGWDLIYHSGWEFLKGYFSTLVRYFSDTDYPIVLKPKERIRKLEEWSDLKETINYLSKERHKHSICQGIIWFLVDLWYDENMNTESSRQKPPCFNILPPHRRQIMERCQEIKRRKAS